MTMGHSIMTGELSPTWYIDCLGGASRDYCRKSALTYGQWLRDFSLEDKLELIREDLPPTGRIWFIFSHSFPGEEEQIVDGLQEDLALRLSFEKSNATVYLFDND